MRACLPHEARRLQSFVQTRRADQRHGKVRQCIERKAPECAMGDGIEPAESKQRLRLEPGNAEGTVAQQFRGTARRHELGAPEAYRTKRTRRYKVPRPRLDS